MVPGVIEAYPGSTARDAVGRGNALRDVWHLRTVDWLQELSEDELARLRRGSAYRDYDKGETLFAPEDHPHSLYPLEHDLARIYRLSPDGSRVAHMASRARPDR